MSAKIVELRPIAPRPTGFLRIGHTGHRKIEALRSSGKFPYRRVVFDAAHVEEQLGLLKALKDDGCEVVLDPNFAETASIGKYATAVSKLPWGNPDRPWEPRDFERGRNLDVAASIAEFAVQIGTNVVLSPVGLIERSGSRWAGANLRMAEALRQELDRLGATDVAIDYQILTTAAVFKDASDRDELLHRVGDLPVDNIWLRIAGFGSLATGVGTRSYIEAAYEAGSVGKPLVADWAGGLPGLAAIAFGAVGGLSHGVGQHESFDAGSWQRPPRKGGGGSQTRAYIPQLDRYLTEGQLDSLFELRGTRSRFCCSDPSCCRLGREDMVDNANAHFITQRFRQVQEIASTPDSRRAENFLLRHVDPAVRSATFAARLDVNDAKLKASLGKGKKRLVRFRDALADLHESTAGRREVALVPRHRGSGGPFSAVLAS